MTLTLRQCECLVALAEEQHFGRAAARLGIAQPPVSIQIRKLEEELGVQLLDRTTRALAFTDAGRIFARAAAAVLDTIDRAAQEARRAARGETGQLRIGYAGSIMFTRLADVMRQFRIAHPDVDLQLREIPSISQLDALLEDRIDIALPREPRKDNRVRNKVLVREKLILAVPASHVLARRKAIPIDKLDGESMIHMPRVALPSMLDRLVAALETKGVHPVWVQETSEWLTSVSLVAAGFGVAVVPESFRRFGRDGVVYRDLAGSSVKTTISVCTRQNEASALVKTFATALESGLRAGARKG
jgi:DNA-binding transcriptional LysR family regulator